MSFDHCFICSEKYYCPSSNRGTPRTDQTHAFRTVKALARDRQKAAHFRWAAKWSTDVRELETLKDGAKACITKDAGIVEIQNWRQKFAGQSWASFPDLNSKSTKRDVAVALAAVRKLVFTHSASQAEHELAQEESLGTRSCTYRQSCGK